MSNDVILTIFCIAMDGLLIVAAEAITEAICLSLRILPGAVDACRTCVDQDLGAGVREYVSQKKHFKFNSDSRGKPII